MARASGTTVDLPGGWSILPGRRPLGLGGDPLPDRGPVQDVVVALRDGMELVDELALGVAPADAGSGRSDDEPGVPRFEVPVGPDESAAVLVEVAGVLTWRGAVPGPDGGRAAAGTAATAVVLLDDLPTPPTSGAAVELGAAPDSGHVVVRVFRLEVGGVAGPLAPGASSEAARTALIALPTGDPATWHEVPVDDVAPAVEGGRSLVLVHDVLSDTVGSFAGLGAGQAGRRWLASAARGYDAVLGFDHPALAVDPRRNATELRRLLERLGAAHVDLVAHAGGALVCHELVELLREHGSSIEVDHLAVVGPDPAWPSDLRLVADMATNLAVSAIAAYVDTAGAAGGVPPAIASGLVGTGLSTLVRAVAAGATDASRVPGLAALAAAQRRGRGATRTDDALVGLHDPATLAALATGLELPGVGEQAVRTSRGGTGRGVALGQATSRRGESATPPPDAAVGTTGRDPTVTRTTHELGARMSERMTLGEQATLEVALSSGLLELEGPGVVTGTAGVVLDESRPVVVDVWPRRNVELVDPGRLELSPPGPGDPPTRRYVTVVATGVGAAAIDVVARQGSAPLATITLQPVVTATPAAGRPPTLEVSAVALSPVPLVRWLHRLTVWRNDTPVGPRLDAMLESPVLDQSRRFEGPVLQEDLASHVEGIRTRIEHQAEWAASGDELLDEIRMLGIELFEGLLHEELRGLLWQHREQLDGLQIRTNDPHVPWEIVHLAPPDGRVPDGSWFLADLGVVRWLEDLAQPFPAPTLAADRVLVVAPEYPAGSGWELPAVDEEVAALERTFAAERVEASRRAVLASLGEPFDVLHYAGHGVAAPGDGLDAELVIGLERHGPSWARVTLPSMLVRRLRFDPARRPLIVLNACQVGQGQQRIGGLGGFARAFLDAGAAAVVAPLWSVGDRPAAVFVDHLYERLRAGDDISEASRAARRHARELDELSWLAYSVHANPEARLDGAASGGGP